MTSEENKLNKWDECKDCIYFQEVEEEILNRYNSPYDIALELNKFINECNYCKEITKC
ncbi:MAG: hypothetical protein J6R47_05020 [Acholeplasmatales bacterium]|nr:hypothetical protein [Acholeplasmatales bacterium]